MNVPANATTSPKSYNVYVNNAGLGLSDSASINQNAYVPPVKPTLEIRTTATVAGLRQIHINSGAIDPIRSLIPMSVTLVLIKLGGQEWITTVDFDISGGIEGDVWDVDWWFDADFDVYGCYIESANSSVGEDDYYYYEYTW